ncbi:nucleotidyltransferase family protein [Vampirovibrio chlorellavorus]|uniref:nucleotidyltransferase family protein n=1 Tax=Vampirovibrio chlorellavorus TaxID=758823 RepID=UPI0026F23BC0|nr:nucleotidyltransferase family protein [Vampirovibrio chlorellavorus]
MEAFRRCFLISSLTLSDALRNMNDTGFRAAIVVDDKDRMLGLVTDGDVRKSLLKGISLNAPLTDVMNPQPLVGQAGLSREEYLPLMVENGNECLPIVDTKGRVVDLVFMRDFVQPELLKSSMVIMAGGAGKRLWPLTRITPKPLLPVANKPILQHILIHARSQGFKNVWVSTHYKAEQVENFLHTSTPSGMQANILREESPLGTAGCLKALETHEDDKPLFIMNGDILTQLDFQAMLDWHRSHGNLLTVACRQFSHQVPYGVLETDGQRLISVQEKPTHYYNINAGIYLLERQALRYIPENVHFDMTDLIDALIHAERPVGTFPISESWIDIGQHEDYERVNRDSHQFLSPVGGLA